MITCCAAAALAALQGPPAGAQAPVTLVQVYVRGMLKCHASVLRCVVTMRRCMYQAMTSAGSIYIKLYLFALFDCMRVLPHWRPSAAQLLRSKSCACMHIFAYFIYLAVYFHASINQCMHATLWRNSLVRWRRKLRRARMHVRGAAHALALLTLFPACMFSFLYYISRYVDSLRMYPATNLARELAIYIRT